MKNIKSFNTYINEKVNWGKQPWKFIKNLMRLEEKDEDHTKQNRSVSNVNQETKSPDDIVDMTITFQMSILRPDTPNSVGDAMELLMKKHNLTGTVYYCTNIGLKFKLKLNGKRKNANAFYDELKKLI